MRAANQLSFVHSIVHFRLIRSHIFFINVVILVPFFSFVNNRQLTRFYRHSMLSIKIILLQLYVISDNHIPSEKVGQINKFILQWRKKRDYEVV